MQLPKFHRCHSGEFLKHHNKMACIRIADIMGDLLDFSVMFHDKKLLCPVDPVGGQILIDGTVKITHEKSGKILRRNINALRQRLGLPYKKFRSVLLPAGHISPTRAAFLLLSAEFPP